MASFDSTFRSSRLSRDGTWQFSSSRDKVRGRRLTSNRTNLTISQKAFIKQATGAEPSAVPAGPPLAFAEFRPGELRALDSQHTRRQTDTSLDFSDWGHVERLRPIGPSYPVVRAIVELQ